VGNFVANLLQYLCAKNCQNIVQFDEVIAKIKVAIFLPHSLVTVIKVKQQQYLIKYLQCRAFVTSEVLATGPVQRSLYHRLRYSTFLGSTGAIWKAFFGPKTVIYTRTRTKVGLKVDGDLPHKM